MNAIQFKILLKQIFEEEYIHLNIKILSCAYKACMEIKLF